MMSIGIKENLLHFINDFIKERSFQVAINGCESTKRTLINGLPQGSVLLCQLFLIAINNLFASSNIDIKYAIYADDIVMFCSHNKLINIQTTMQENLNKLYTSAHKNGFKFSNTKSNAVHTQKKRHLRA